MSIQHKFLNHNWNNGFWTENAILKSEYYKPEVLFLGTFNHGFPWNSSDFFYGRDMYMWTILANLFLYNHNYLYLRRTCNNNTPTLEQIFDICKKGKMSFTDLIKGTPENIPAIENIMEKKILVGQENYVWDNYKDKSIIDLINLGYIENNVNEIIRFINENTTIKFVYCTFKSGNEFLEMIEDIRQNVRDGVEINHIFSPTGNGFLKNLPEYDERPWSLAHCWIWNNQEHNIPISKPGYSNLNHQWLIDKGINPNNF